MRGSSDHPRWASKPRRSLAAPAHPLPQPRPRPARTSPAEAGCASLRWTRGPPLLRAAPAAAHTRASAAEQLAFVHARVLATSSPRRLVHECQGRSSRKSHHGVLRRVGKDLFKDRHRTELLKLPQHVARLRSRIGKRVGDAREKKMCVSRAAGASGKRRPCAPRERAPRASATRCCSASARRPASHTHTVRGGTQVVVGS